MLMFSYLMMSLSLIMMFSSHPVTILLIILLQASLVCLSMFISMKTSWFSFILFLIFLGGLMVLFVYIVSLASNEKFYFGFYQTKIMLLSSVYLLTMVFSIMFFEKMMPHLVSSFYSQVFIIFTSNLMVVTVLIMFYLLFTLVVAVKISSKFEGPLRSMS